MYIYIGEFNQNVKLLFKLSFVHLCEESCVAIASVFYGYFVVLFFFSWVMLCHVGRAMFDTECLNVLHR